jgi:hypothetical protein
MFSPNDDVLYAITKGDMHSRLLISRGSFRAHT